MLDLRQTEEWRGAKNLVKGIKKGRSLVSKGTGGLCKEFGKRTIMK
jgi:hypothetical protein